MKYGAWSMRAGIRVSRFYAERFPTLFDAKTFIVGNGIDLADWSNWPKIQLPGTRPISSSTSGGTQSDERTLRRC